MAKLKRKQALKRKTAQAHHHLDVFVHHMAGLYDAMVPTHPELGELLEAMGKQALILQSELEDFWRICWGELPADLESWR